MTYHRVNKQVSSLILLILKEPSLAQFQILKLFDIYFQYYDDINLKTSKDVQKWWEKFLSICKLNELLYYPNIHVLMYTKRPNLLSTLG